MGGGGPPGPGDDRGPPPMGPPSNLPRPPGQGPGPGPGQGMMPFGRPPMMMGGMPPNFSGPLGRSIPSLDFHSLCVQSFSE